MTDGSDKVDSDVGAEVDSDVFESASPGQPTENELRWVALPPASMLSLEDADALLRWRAASLVAVVGERNGGKTTLVSELYERFLRGPFAGSLFAHSLSLLGFERKSFQSRAVSGAERPDTPRTSKQDGLSFFHLAISDESNLQRTDLLISERAGEVYREVRDRPAEATSLVEVRKARTVAFILDGERIADARRRAEAIASVRHIARAFADSGAIAADAEIQTVTTKCDLLQGDGLVGARDALSAFEEQFVSTYASRFAVVSTHRIAARDPEGVMEAAFGLAPLLRSWLRPVPPAVMTSLPTPQLADEFDSLLVRSTV